MVGLFSFGGRLVLIIPELGRAEQRDEEDDEKEEKSKCGREREKERERRGESGEWRKGLCRGEAVERQRCWMHFSFFVFACPLYHHHLMMARRRSFLTYPESFCFVYFISLRCLSSFPPFSDLGKTVNNMALHAFLSAPAAVMKRTRQGAGRCT